MISKSKKTTILICLITISFFTINREIPKTDSIDPFFTLVALAQNPTDFDYFNLIKQQLSRIGVNLDVIIIPPHFLQDYRGTFDLEIINIHYSSIDSPFLWNFYSENGTHSIYGYEESLDWDENLNAGKNQWYIENGIEMIANNSEDVQNYCWEWQNYLLDEVLPCLPLFVQKNDSDYFQVLAYNMKETHQWLGNREPSFENPDRSIGLAIRKALTYAINREEIRRVVLGDEFKVIDHPINPFLGNWCNPNVVRYCHDLKVAARYFNSAGFGTCGTLDPRYYDTNPDWSDWEAVCSRNEPIEPTIDVAGYTLVVSCLAVGIVTTAFAIYHIKKRKLLR
ncbi:MAG: hypothetical protein GPJ52_12865 [Candidatus Heimdallarchaeota archaeon]|nr:hypothetical protein [Candidatus Heimdallarchaeota archaeon]